MISMVIFSIDRDDVPFFPQAFLVVAVPDRVSDHFLEQRFAAKTRLADPRLVERVRAVLHGRREVFKCVGDTAAGKGSCEVDGYRE